MNKAPAVFALATLTLAGAALAGCTAAAQRPAAGQPASPPRSPDGDGECEASAAQSLVGQQASAETDQQLLALTGARHLRWVAPGMAVTMDFRHDRLTVTYDQTMRIERISCG